MPLPQPYAGSDDSALAAGCVDGDEEAWAELRRRHGTLVSAAVVRATDGPRASEIDLDALIDLVWRHARQHTLVTWSGESQLKSYLAIVARHVAEAEAPNASSARRLTPLGTVLDDRRALEPVVRVEDAIDKLPPNIGALVRLRLEGLFRDDIAATLGVSPAAVKSNLERVAARLGERDELDVDTSACWRVVLDAAEIEERVALAVRTREEEAVRAMRSRVEATWRAIASRALARPTELTAACLDERATAGFVDGTLRGAGRARAESHVATCPRCLDEAAALVIDLRAASILREASALPSIVAVAAACVASTRFAAAERLTQRAREQGHDEPVVRHLRRLAQAVRHLEGGGVARPEATSQVVATQVPEDDEAPLIAFEALVLGDPRTAWRAIDGPMAKPSLGARLRLLAAAAGQDLERARLLAEQQLASPRVDPGHALDAATVMALPRGTALPEELLVARLRALLPDAVRFVLKA